MVLTLLFFITDLSISTGCCEALNHIVTFLFTNYQKATKSDNPMKELTDHPALKILEIRSEIFQQVFRKFLLFVSFYLICTRNKILFVPCYSSLIRYGGFYLTWASGCCLLYTSPSPRDKRQSRMPSSA